MIKSFLITKYIILNKLYKEKEDVYKLTEVIKPFFLITKYIILNKLCKEKLDVDN